MPCFSEKHGDEFWLKPVLHIRCPLAKANGNELKLLKFHCRPIYGTDNS